MITPHKILFRVVNSVAQFVLFDVLRALGDLPYQVTSVNPVVVETFSYCALICFPCVADVMCKGCCTICRTVWSAPSSLFKGYFCTSLPDFVADIHICTLSSFILKIEFAYFV
jgi:hypothetical protein